MIVGRWPGWFCAVTAGHRVLVTDGFKSNRW